METLKGVYPAYKKNKQLYYRSSLTFLRKHVSLGSYDLLTDANNAYREANALLHSTRTILDYNPKKNILSFEKWVILCNFRDHKIYFKTPIYLRQKYFLYYLSPDDILKFDSEDLFYFSTHKIMRRKGHLFVADYGMQVNILNRYQIRSHSVPGRDHLFINSDPTDFRRENLQIINRFYGVTKKKQKLLNTFCTKININGTWIVGIYKTEDEAAIAYNKAVDTLNAIGINKSYTINFLEGISPRVYAEIYHNIKFNRNFEEFIRINSKEKSV